MRENRERHLKIFVAGAGTMGHGLALLMARAGHEVVLADVNDEVLERAISSIRSHMELLSEMDQVEGSEIQGVIDRIRPVVGLEGLAEADLIMENISEDLHAKKAFYAEVAGLCAPDAIVTSNTSYLNIFELAPETLQARLLITHFFAPPYLIPLVEIVKGPKTVPGVVQEMRQILFQAGNKPVIMEKFIPGFIVNRLQRAVGREIFHLIDGGYAKPEEIDKAVLASLGIRIPVLGVVRRYDFGGLDLALKILSNPSIGLVNEDRPSKTLEELVSKGHLGVKTGKGFYDYGGETQEEIYRKRDRFLIRIRNLVDEIEEELWGE
ncbi:MAG: 3-hydroxyacyl-CoA dehydrogenase family protein [Deltaproteobacteria bacterium]|nr:3-hydroxyacyl-CoA dehydrogenase family protein [Deltaproteobacteria bacterium]MBW2049023.1 3-hydroxyacyl-CoA dehydrogenase family protein [Deltaproteobacteria bacterium]MBW2354592.1 3-hydroxyacyl-CoA dehydrogenase family protein [Deltaproteobacteria bacterium]